MKHHDVDASLLPAEPQAERLEDGFSPPLQDAPEQETHPAARGEADAALLSPKSPF